MLLKDMENVAGESKKKTLSIQKLAYLQSSLQLTSNNRNPQWIQATAELLRYKTEVYLLSWFSLFHREDRALLIKKNIFMPKMQFTKKKQNHRVIGDLFLFFCCLQKNKNCNEMIKSSFIAW